MAIEQPLLPTARDRNAEVAVVETDHRRREGVWISCQLEGESIRPGLPDPGPPQLHRTKREGHETEEDGNERESRHVRDRRKTEGGMRNGVQPGGERNDHERG